jgi:hypothetical protein
LFVVQVRYDIFNFRNRSFQSNFHVQNQNSGQIAEGAEQEDEDLFAY